MKKNFGKGVEAVRKQSGGKGFGDAVNILQHLGNTKTGFDIDNFNKNRGNEGMS